TPPRNFIGTWSGTVSQSATTCSDGTSSAATTAQWNLTLLQTASQVQWRASCGVEITADVLLDGTEAQQSGSASCPPITATTGQVVTRTISGLHMTVADGLALDLSFHSTTTITGATAGTCNAEDTGVLQRKIGP